MSFINFLTKTEFINQTVLFEWTRTSLSKDYAKFNAESREK